MGSLDDNGRWLFDSIDFLFEGVGVLRMNQCHILNIA